MADQKAEAHFRQAEVFIRTNLGMFARQGAVVASWRTYQGRKLGPYYRVDFREGRRLRSLYLGVSEVVADRVRKILDKLHAPRRERRKWNRMMAQLRRSLREAKAELAYHLQRRYGILTKGYEFRGMRRAFPAAPIEVELAARRAYFSRKRNRPTTRAG